MSTSHPDKPSRQADEIPSTRRNLPKSAEARLQLLSSLLDNLPGIAFRCLNDKDLTFEYASKAAEKILGYPPEQIVSGYTFRQMVHPDDQAQNKKIIASLTPVNNRYNMTYRMRDAHGNDKWVHEQGTAVFSAQGNLIAIDGLLTDITEHKHEEIRLHKENIRLRSSIKERYRLGELIGKSHAMQKVYERIIKAADSVATVIVTGESGTGKELVARAIHELSDRKDKPFVAVNCGAIAETLLESEFFGSLKGAFSGAYANRRGFLTAADQGTLFLDEIGEMPIQLQIKLLRALDGKSFIPVGDHKSLNSDFRLICATNRNLVAMVREGLMREDFYYRVNTIPISMPPLRERKEDLPLLIDHFIGSLHDGNGPVPQLPSEFYLTLDRHNWPGNVRELQNVIRRYLTLKEISFGPLLAAPAMSHTPETTARQAMPKQLTVTDELAQVERDRIVNALHTNFWHIGNTAKALGISRRTLQRRLSKHKINKS